MAVARFAAVLLFLSLAVSPGHAADTGLALEVVINGYAAGRVGEFTLRDGALFARPGELRDLGLKVPESVAVEDGLVALSALPGVTVRLDQASQTLRVTAASEQLVPATLMAGAGSAAGRVESGSGAVLNYDMTASSAVGTTSGTRYVGSGLFDLRGFSPWGVVSSTELTYLGASPNGAGTNAAIRLDSSYVNSDPQSLRRWRVGDFISSGLNWSRALRLGGMQISSDFSMRPDLVTYPLPSLAGSVAVPSTVDVLVNGTRLLSQQVAPGPFQIPQLPVLTGAGTVSLTTVDALGRQVTTTLPFYASAILLAPGLQSYAVEIGAVRRNWGIVSNDYRDPAGAATYRRGLSPDLTVEAHAEGTSGQVMAGGGIAVNVFDRGVANLAAAASTASGRTGSQVSAGFQRSGQTVSFGASATFADPNFRDIASMNGDPAPRRLITANAGLSLGRFGSVGVAYAGIDRQAVPAPISFFVPPGYSVNQNTQTIGGTISSTGGVFSYQPAQHAHVLSASYSVQYAKLSFYATGYHDFASSSGNGSSGSGSGSGVLVGVTIPLGDRSWASASGGQQSHDRSGQMQVAQTPVSVGDWGYQAYAQYGQFDHEFGQLQYKSPWALLTGGVDRIDGQNTLRAEAQGALAWAGGGLFAANSINDAFAVVDTEGTKGIRVLSENRDAGRTNSAGQLLVPDLRSFDRNHLAIDPMDVPFDATVAVTVREVRPQDRSGVVVRFPVHTSHGAVLRLVDGSGRPIRLGSIATLRSTGVTVPVGYDGEAYVVDLGSRNVLAVERRDGHRCTVEFSYQPVAGEIPTIGPLTCKESGQ